MDFPQYPKLIVDFLPQSDREGLQKRLIELRQAVRPDEYREVNSKDELLLLLRTIPKLEGMFVLQIIAHGNATGFGLNFTDNWVCYHELSTELATINSHSGGGLVLNLSTICNSAFYFIELGNDKNYYHTFIGTNSGVGKQGAIYHSAELYRNPAKTIQDLLEVEDFESDKEPGPMYTLLPKEREYL